MGTRGQVVIPVRIRKKLGIKAGGKFMVFLAPPRAVIFIPSNQFERMVSEFDKRLIKLRRLAK
jgi:AbrB family looped-hinge helix DNA binding protein